MKKSIRIIAIICVLCVCSVFLSSCSYLDDVRAQHAVIDGEKIIFNGKTYVKFLDETVGLNIRADFSGFVTEGDVPVLLSDFLGTPFVYDSVNDIMRFSGALYCQESRVGEYLALFSGDIFSLYCIRVLDSESVLKELTVFTAEENTLMDNVLDNTTPVELNIGDLDEYKTVYIDECDKSCRFFSNTPLMLYFDEKANEYGVVRYDLSDDKYYEYKVSDDNKEGIKAIFDKYYKVYEDTEILV